MIASNPADKASPPTPRHASTRAPTVTGVQRLIETAETEDPILATAIALAATTGASRGEICALRWEYVDWTQQQIRIDKSLTVIKRETSLGPTETHQRRDISLDQGLLKPLADRRQQQNETYLQSSATQSLDPTHPTHTTVPPKRYPAP
jgi:integrase